MVTARYLNMEVDEENRELLEIHGRELATDEKKISSNVKKNKWKLHLKIKIDMKNKL